MTQNDIVKRFETENTSRITKFFRDSVLHVKLYERWLEDGIINAGIIIDRFALREKYTIEIGLFPIIFDEGEITMGCISENYICWLEEIMLNRDIILNVLKNNFK